MKKLVSFFTLLIFILLSSGCSEKHKVLFKNRSAVKKEEKYFMDPEGKKKLLEQREESYRINPGDRLMVTVVGHPELSTPKTITEMDKTLVDNDGTIQLPLIGLIKIAGYTAVEVKGILTKKLKKYLKNPEVLVQVAKYNGVRYYLLGEFITPGMQIADQPLTLLEILALGKGVKLGTANLRRAFIARNGKKLPINLYALLKEGDLSQDIPLKNGDIIFIPDNTNELAYVIGEVTGQPSGRTVHFINGKLTLLHALSKTGYAVAQAEFGDLSNVHIIRPQADRVEYFVVDIEKILSGEALPFELVPGDIIYVPKSKIGSFNLLLKQIQPFFLFLGNAITPALSYKQLLDTY